MTMVRLSGLPPSSRIPVWELSFQPASSSRPRRSEEHTSELQSPCKLVCRLLLEKKKRQDGVGGRVERRNLVVAGQMRRELLGAVLAVVVCAVTTGCGAGDGRRCKTVHHQDGERE